MELWDQPDSPPERANENVTRYTGTTYVEGSRRRVLGRLLRVPTGGLRSLDVGLLVRRVR